MWIQLHEYEILPSLLICFAGGAIVYQQGGFVPVITTAVIAIFLWVMAEGRMW